MEDIQNLAGQCKVALASQTVSKGECCYTFYNPFSSNDGIVVNLNTFIGTIPDMAFNNMPNDSGEPQQQQQQRGLFLRIVKKRVEKTTTTTTTTTATTSSSMDTGDGETAPAPAPVAPTKLAIGVEGGFSLSPDEDKYETITTYSVVVLEADTTTTTKVVAEVPYDINDDTIKSTFPMMVSQSVDSIIHHVGMSVQQDLTAWQDDEVVPTTKYYKDLPFVDNGVQISPDPKSWKCQKRGDTENLWLNLSDGFIGGGRKNWDGSGGSNGALDHFEETGEKYPLVVKLGTITTDPTTGEVSADCFSYAKDEDGPVQIPNLAELLLRRGIKVAGLQKTEKSTAELEVELNANYAFDAITESGSKLTAVSGPGEQGLQNLGNSCYLNSVVQALASLPEVNARYGKKPGENVTDHHFLKGSTPTSAPTELLVQATKLVTALTSGAYAIPEDQLDSDGPIDPKYRLAPRMFKHLIGKDHVDFKTAQQQDAAHFLQYLLEQLDRSEAKYDREMLNTSYLFSFKMEERLVCTADRKVKYKSGGAPESVWSLRLPMEKAETKEPEPKKFKQEGEAPTQGSSEGDKSREKDDEKQIPTLTFAQCVESWAAETSLDDYRWPHLQNTVSPGVQTTRFQNFPRYLWVQAQRYELGPDWQPVKLEVNLDIPESIDLSSYKASGPKDGEDLVPAEEAGGDSGTSQGAPRESPQIDEAALSQLMDMGFNMNGCKRALMAVGGSNTEAAMNWIFEHNMDPDFNDPLPESSAPAPATGATSDGSGVDDAVVMSLVENLGCFTIDQVRAALKETKGAADRAADWLFSHMDDLDGAIASLESNNNDGSAADSSNNTMIPLEDGDGKYTMVGMISHIGKNTGSGHYVAHLKHNGKWVIYNDEKVALSESPPIQHAYLYLFQRTDTMGSPPNPQY